MTDFEKKVLRIVSEIPLGELRSYKWVAQKAGKPRASRAVANALAKNPYPLFIPCHRVVKSSGDIGGFYLGRRLKQQLIKLEKKIKAVVE